MRPSWFSHLHGPSSFFLGTFSVIRGKPYFLSHVLATCHLDVDPPPALEVIPNLAKMQRQVRVRTKPHKVRPRTTMAVLRQPFRQQGADPPVVHRRHLRPAIGDSRDQISCISSCGRYGLLIHHSRPAEEKEARRSSCPAVPKKPDFARQQAFNERLRVLTSVDAALESLPDDAEEVRSIPCKVSLTWTPGRKHIRIADKFDWETVEEYADVLVGENHEDDRRIASAASLARRLARGSQDLEDPPAVSQHRRSFRNFASLASPPVHRHTSSATPLFDPRCYLCGETGHIARRCHLLWSSQQRSRLASSASPWPSRNQWRPSTPAPTVSQLSHGCQRGRRPAPVWEVAAETKISVECGHDVAGGVCVKWNKPDPIDDVSLSSFDCPYPESPPKGVVLVMLSC